MNLSAKISLSLIALNTLAAAAAELKVDLNPPERRSDILTPHWENWAWPGAATGSRQFGAVTVTFRSPAGEKLSPILFKALLDDGVHMGLDGFTTPDSTNGGFEMVVSGLSPGDHTIVTYHNEVREKSAAAFDVLFNGQPLVKSFSPTWRATNDYEVAATCLKVSAVAGQDVVLRFVPVAGAKNRSLIMNGFEIDTADPRAKAIEPLPANDDEHWPNENALTWKPGVGVVSHQLYFGTDSNAVAIATPASPEFKGNLAGPSFSLPILDPQQNYFWRVDEVDAAKATTHGELWRFRVRTLAFPSAEGYGRFAIGGRGGRIIKVTNLDDYEPGRGEAVIPGSFRAAVEAEGPRTIVFGVSGLIHLKAPCAVHNPYCTIAGQTAPGDGICLADNSGGAFATHDVIIRYLRFRIGDAEHKAMDGCGLGSCDNCIIDHCSISWSSDEGTSSRSGHDITFQRNIVAEALHHGPRTRASDRSKLETHAFAGSISGDIGSYHHNLLADCTDRNWSLAGGLTQGGKYAGHLDIRNNVVYNWTARTTDGGVKELNYVNNYYKPHPPAKFVKWLLKLDPINPNWGTESYYMTGNILEGYVDEDHNWDAFANGSKVEKQVRVDHELYPSYVKTHTAREAFTNVLADVGANLPKQDVIDRHIIEETRDGTTHYIGTRGPTYGDRPSPNVPGLIDTQSDDKSALGSANFPWPEYKTYNVPMDSNNNGIPDDWERAHGLNPNGPNNANGDFNGDGYTNLEKYLNSLTGEYAAAVDAR